MASFVYLLDTTAWFSFLNDSCVQFELEVNIMSINFLRYISATIIPMQVLDYAPLNLNIKDISTTAWFGMKFRLENDVRFKILVFEKFLWEGLYAHKTCSLALATDIIFRNIVPCRKQQ